jgi:hypothetical protein
MHFYVYWGLISSSVDEGGYANGTDSILSSYHVLRQVFWDVTPCSLVNCYQRVVGSFCRQPTPTVKVAGSSETLVIVYQTTLGHKAIWNKSFCYRSLFINL